VSDVPADRRVHPGTIALRFLRDAPRTVLAIPAVLAFASDRGVMGALGLAAVVAVVALVFQWLQWRHFRYGVGAREIVIESGLIHRTRRSIPFDRIQDIDIERALLARIFGLAKVRIETGAGGKDEGLLDSVTLAEAGRLRAVVRAWRDGDAAAVAARTEGNDAEPESRAQPPIFTMGLPRVLLFGVLDFSLVYLGGLLAFLQTFEEPLKAGFGFDIYDPVRWIGVAEGAAQVKVGAGTVGALVLFALLLGLLASIVRILARDYGYRLTAEGDRFRRERGLLTRTEAVIAKERVQLAYVETGPIRRRFGWFWLSFQTLGAGSDGSGHQVAAPFARREEMAPILAETGRFRLPPPPELVMVSQRHVVRALLRRLALPCVAILGAAAWYRPALFLLALLPFLAIHAMLERHFHRYAIDGDLLFVTRGVLKQKLFVVPVERIQVIGLARSWLQRKLGLATVAVDTAGASITKSPGIVDVTLDTGQSLVAELARLRRQGSAPSPVSS
jgi:putative membrane protein